MSKYRAEPTIYNGERYASKGEARAAQVLDILIKAGEVLWWVRQVPFYLPWHTKVTIDFCVCYASCGVRFIEFKGMETREARERRRALEWFLGEPIIVWHKEDVEI